MSRRLQPRLTVAAAVALAAALSITGCDGGAAIPAISPGPAGGAPPDVALIPQPGVVAQYARKGQLVPLTGDASAAVSAN